jgi:parallel beta-helix repeat protein
MVAFILFILASAPILLSFSPSAFGQVQGANYIHADGTITGTFNIQQNGNLYTYTNTVAGQLIVEKDNVIIDGAGYTLQGSNGRGIDLSNRSNVTVQNMVIKLEGGYSIQLSNSSGCTIRGNTLTWKPQSTQPFLVQPTSINFLNANGNLVDNNTIAESQPAIQLDWSQNNTITNNKITDSRIGIDIIASTDNLLRNNHMINCTNGFALRTYSAYTYSNDIDTSNTVDGNPIIYWQNIQDASVPDSADYIALINCSKVSAQNASPEGAVLAFSSDCTLSRITFKAGSQVALENCSRITLSECSITQYGGLSLDGSSNNTITGCVISNSSGIRLANSNGNVIRNCNFTANSYALAPFQDTPSTGNIIAENLFSKNQYALTLQSGNTISGNNFTGNEHAISFVSGSSTIAGNNFQNNGVAVTLGTQGNVLRSNIFSNNTASLQVSGANFNNDVDASNTVDGKPIVYWVDRKNQIVPTNAGLVVLANCTNIKVQNCTLAKQDCGIILAFTQNSTVANNLIMGNAKGVYFHASSYNQIVGNNITANGYGVYISGATFIYFMVAGYTPSSGNVFFGNNFAGNNQTVYDVAAASGIQWETAKPSVSVNEWDNGTTGNYWSVYNGTDANGDGIGDTPYNVYPNNTDYYPLMQPTANAVPVQPIATPNSELPAWAVPASLAALAVASVFVVVFIFTRKAGKKPADSENNKS